MFCLIFAFDLKVNNYRVVALESLPSSRFITIWWQRRDDFDNYFEPFL